MRSQSPRQASREIAQLGAGDADLSARRMCRGETPCMCGHRCLQGSRPSGLTHAPPEEKTLSSTTSASWTRSRTMPTYSREFRYDVGDSASGRHRNVGMTAMSTEFLVIAHTYAHATLA